MRKTLTHLNLKVVFLLFLISLNGCNTQLQNPPSSTATKPQWKFFAVGDHFDFYIDLNSVRKVRSKQTNFITYTMLTNGPNSPQFAAQKIQSLTNSVLIDCYGNNYRVTSTAGFDSPFAEGKLKLASNEQSDAIPIKKQTMTWAVRNLFCDAPIVWDN